MLVNFLVIPRQFKKVVVRMIHEYVFELLLAGIKGEKRCEGDDDERDGGLVAHKDVASVMRTEGAKSNLTGALARR